MQTDSQHPMPAEAARLARRHLRFGWWSLLVFLTFGLGLELLHGFKIGLYLDLQNETRRLMWTLAHAHGTLLALINLAFAFSIPWLTRMDFRRRNLASACLLSASILLPAGFFFGGVFVYGGDPGLAVLLVPAGAVLLFAAVLMIARAFSPESPTNAPAATPAKKAAVRAK